MAQEAWQEPGVWRLPRPTHRVHYVASTVSAARTRAGTQAHPRAKVTCTLGTCPCLSSKPGTEAQSGSSVLELWDLGNFPIPSPSEDVLLKETTAPTPSS